MHPGINPVIPMRGPAVAINLSGGTNFGDMTSQGGLAAAFDGNASQIATACATRLAGGSTTTAYVGKTLAAATVLNTATISGASDQGYAQGSGGDSTTLTIYGKKGSAPANGTDGTSLGSVTFTDSNAVNQQVINSNDTVNYWDHIWVYLSIPTRSADNKYLAELSMTGWQ